jgi:hypothetical protein
MFQVDSVRDAAFGCDWMGTPVPFQRCLIFIIATANKQFRLTAGKFIPVSNETMMNVRMCVYTYVHKMYILRTHVCIYVLCMYVHLPVFQLFSQSYQCCFEKPQEPKCRDHREWSSDLDEWFVQPSRLSRRKHYAVTYVMPNFVFPLFVSVADVDFSVNGGCIQPECLPPASPLPVVGPVPNQNFQRKIRAF